MARESKKQQETGYEDVMSRLEDVVRRLEAGNLPLEESLKAFEEGVALVRLGEARLNEAEKRVEQLLATPAGDKVVPLDPEARGAEPRRGAPAPAAPEDEDIPF